MKTCKKCGIEKDLEEFYKEKKSKDGYRGSCKICMSEYTKSVDKKHRKEIVKKSYYKNIDKNKNYYINNKDTLKKYRMDRYNKNKLSENEKARKYSKENREILNKYRIEYDKKRSESDPLYKLIKNIRNLIKISLNTNGYSKKSRTHEIIGIDFIDFKSYIESKFEFWMCWSNYGEYTGNYNETWQFDHIIPISSGRNEEEIIRLNYYTNFQPLCSKKNIEKSNKII